MNMHGSGPQGSGHRAHTPQSHSGLLCRSHFIITESWNVRLSEDHLVSVAQYSLSFIVEAICLQWVVAAGGAVMDPLRCQLHLSLVLPPPSAAEEHSSRTTDLIQLTFTFPSTISRALFECRPLCSSPFIGNSFGISFFCIKIGPLWANWSRSSHRRYIKQMKPHFYLTVYQIIKVGSHVFLSLLFSRLNGSKHPQRSFQSFLSRRTSFSLE